MLNRSAACQAAVMHPRDPRGDRAAARDDCHVIANTAWRNPPDFKGGPWHCDAGPHVPRPEDVPWDDRIPYPVFAVARASDAGRLHRRRRPDRGRARQPSQRPPRAVRPHARRELVVRRPAAARSSRRRPATSRSSSPTCGTGVCPQALVGAAATSCRCTTAGATSRNGSRRRPRPTSSHRRRSPAPRRSGPARSSVSTTRSSTTGERFLRHLTTVSVAARRKNESS